MAQSSSSYPDGRPAAPSGLPSHSSASLYAPSFSHLQQQQQQPSSPSPFYGAPPSDNAPLLYAPHALSLPAPMAYAGQHQVYGQQQQPLVGGAGAGGYGQPHGGLPVGRTPLVHAASETANYAHNPNQASSSSSSFHTFPSSSYHTSPHSYSEPSSAGSGGRTEASHKRKNFSDGSANSKPAAGVPTKKGKKKSDSVKLEGGGSPSQHEDDEDKRTKTSRACDRCRGKKTRCDIIPDVDPPICIHCQNAKLDCTFFLPITETRFKKKRMEEAKAAAQTEVATSGSAGDMHRASTSASSPATNMGNGFASQSPSGSHGGSAGMQERPQVRVQGPTSIAFLLHSTAAIPSNTFDNYDLRHHMTWEVSASGDGLIKVYHPKSTTDQNSPRISLPPGVESRLGGDVIEKLVNGFFSDVAPYFPVVTRAEFLGTVNPSPLLLYAMCGVAATRRTIPREVFNSLRTTINGIIKNNDVLSDTSLVNVQSLLILSIVGDLHAQPVSAATSAAVLRLGVAIRMAQDLGLHRDDIKRTDNLSEREQLEERAYLELKRRVWSGCVIMDRWFAASLGMPQMIDLLDCDVLLPDPDEVPLPERLAIAPSSQPYLYMSENLKLSILLGRITKTIYGPTGLKHTTDHQLETLLADIRLWKVSLPPALQFNGLDSPHAAGILHMYYTAINFLFFRVFMRISYQCPSHLKFSLDISSWSELFTWATEAIDWLERNDWVLDTSFIVSYSATSIALIQYHTWARRKNPKALESMRKLRDTCRRWENAVQPDHMSIRRKTMEVMSLLYDAARHTHVTHPPAPGGTRLNPTSGVQNNRPPLDGLVTFRADPTQPGGGVFVAENEAVKSAFDQQGLVSGTVINKPAVTVKPNIANSGGDLAVGDSNTQGLSAGRPSRGRTNSVNGSWNVNPNIIGVGEDTGYGTIDPEFGALMHTNDSYFEGANLQGNNGGGLGGIGGGGEGSEAVNGISGSGLGVGFNVDSMVGNTQIGLLEGMPGSMLDWNAWDSFFSRFSLPLDESDSRQIDNSQLQFQIPQTQERPLEIEGYSSLPAAEGDFFGSGGGGGNDDGGQSGGNGGGSAR